MHPLVKRCIKWVVPIALWDHIRSTRFESARQKRKQIRASEGVGSRMEFDYEEAVKFLVARGCDAHQVREGSMWLSALEFAESYFHLLPSKDGLCGLHVGNFV